jgi:hypothetical protein
LGNGGVPARQRGVGVWFRTYGAEAAGERITNVERYEVILSELKEAQS